MIKRDFTKKIYRELLEQLIFNGYSVIPFKNFFYTKSKKIVILRHDVDKKPQNSLEFALIESSLNFSSTYYFRVTKTVYPISIIKKIASMGHEIGYHYEDLVSSNGDLDKAIISFENHLKLLRKCYPVVTICMHGNPLSKWDNRDLWKIYNYKNFGIIGEPYFDIDFNEVFYLTDTGRRWDGVDLSVRDKVFNDKVMSNFRYLRYHNTKDIIEAAEEGKLPDKMMLTTHPQRWNDGILRWTFELISQNFKNLIKKYIVASKSLNAN